MQCPLASKSRENGRKVRVTAAGRWRLATAGSRTLTQCIARPPRRPPAPPALPGWQLFRSRSPFSVYNMFNTHGNRAAAGGPRATNHYEFKSTQQRRAGCVALSSKSRTALNLPFVILPPSTARSSVMWPRVAWGRAFVLHWCMVATSVCVTCEEEVLAVTAGATPRHDAMRPAAVHTVGIQPPQAVVSASNNSENKSPAHAANL